MAGFTVTRSQLDQDAAQAVLAVREAFASVERVAHWLANNPVENNVDPLIDKFEYSADEAYLLRIVFEQLNDLRTGATATMDIARKLTGLQ